MVVTFVKIFAMKKLLFISLVSLVLLSGCKNGTSNNQNIAIAEVKMQIEGMVCETGCAKKIQSTLANTKGVTNAEVNFETGVASIQFDKNKIETTDLVNAVNKINGNLYSAKIVFKPNKNQVNTNTELKKQKPETQPNEEVSVLNLPVQPITFPNIFDVFNRLAEILKK